MAISKVVYKASTSATPETWMDVTDDTVNAGNLLYQETATRNDGVRVTGTVDLSTKQDKITANGILKGDGNGNITAATPVTDYGTYSKPSGGIPSTDLASGVIPDISGKLDAPSTAGTNGQVLTSDGQGGQSWQTPSGGGSLPSVTSSDNGKILQVSSGAWAATNSLADKLDKPSATGLNTQILARDGNSGHKWKDLAATVMVQHGTNPIDQGIYLEEGNASQTNLYFKCQRLGFFYNNGASNVEDRWSTKWFNDIVTELNASTVTSPKGVTGCLQIPNDTALVFDIPSNKMKYVNRSLVTCDQVALFYCAYGRAENPHPLILEARIFQLQKAINNSISVNVKDFGAAGDGSTDDTQAIQNAIEHSHTNGGIVYFPSGTYKLSTALFNSSDSSLASALMCYSGQTLKGDNATLKAGAAAVTHIIYTYNASGATGYSGCSDVTIEGLTFDGNSSLSSNLTAVNLSHSENVLIKRCSFVNGRSWHSIEINSSHNVKVDGCTFSGNSNTEDVQIDSAASNSGNIGSSDDTVCKDIEIFNCMFDVNAYPAIGNHTSAAHNNIRIHDNVFSGGTGASRGYIDFVAAQYNNDIYNNTFYTGAKGVVLANSTANSTVHDNRFISVTTPVSGGAVVYNNLVNDALNSIFVPTGYTFDGSKTNLNNVMTSQNIGSLTMCQYAVNATNRPTDDAGILLSGRNGGSGKYGWQIAFNNTSLYYRAYNNQTFGSWKTINMT